MTPFNRGDVVLVLFPDSNLPTAKRRPALVVQRKTGEHGLRRPLRSAERMGQPGQGSCGLGRIPNEQSPGSRSGRDERQANRADAPAIDNRGKVAILRLPHGPFHGMPAQPGRATAVSVIRLFKKLDGAREAVVEHRVAGFDSQSQR